jgi:hypothetical protein
LDEPLLLFASDAAGSGSESGGSPITNLNKDKMRVVMHNEVDFTKPRKKVTCYQSETLFSKKRLRSLFPIIAYRTHGVSAAAGGVQGNVS